MIARIGESLSRLSHRFVPDPFVLALLLTAIVFACALVVAPAELGADDGGRAWALLFGWYEGFTGKGGLAFALQMSLVLVTGHALALSPPVQRLVDWIARVPRSAVSATALVAVVACVSAVIHWGLGAIVGALLAREVARHAGARGVRLHYPLLGAAAYAGLAVWHGGLSGSAPLTVAQEQHFAFETVGTLPLSETTFGMLNLIVTGSLLVALPILFAAMVPPDEQKEAAPTLPEADAAGRTQDRGGVAGFLHASPWPGRVVGGSGLAWILAAVASDRMQLDLGSVIMAFLFLGILLEGSLERYVASIADGAKGAGGIILQFPFYFGVLGLMKAAGLIEWVSQAIVEISSPVTFPVLAFLSAGLVNLFVPSGGGQWAVQADVLLTAAQSHGVSSASTVMAFAYGDAWTNMLQPFWALPLLGIMGLDARQIIGYTAVAFLAIPAIVVPLLLALA